MACPKSWRSCHRARGRRAQAVATIPGGSLPWHANPCCAAHLHPRRGSSEGTGKPTLQWDILSPLEKAHGLWVLLLSQDAYAALSAESCPCPLCSIDLHHICCPINLRWNREKNERPSALRRVDWFLLDALQEFCLALLWLPPIAVWTSKWATTVLVWI